MPCQAWQLMTCSPTELGKRCGFLQTFYPLMILIVAMTLVFFNISQLPLSFVPINEEREEAAVEWDPDSSQYQTSLLLSTIITIPMIYDLFLDGCAYRLPIFMDVVVGLSRILLVLALTLPNLWVFYLSDDVQKGSHIIASIVFQMASHGCVCVFLSVYNPKTYAGPICLSAVIFNAIGAELHIRQRLPGVGLFFYAVAYCHFLYLFAAWASDWIKTGRKMEASDLVNLTCFISLSILSTGSFAIEIIYKGSFTSVSAASMNYVHLVFTVVLMALPNQIAKFNVRIMLRKTEEKEAFIRYISHEIRTPLNTVFLGMNFIKDELDAIAPLVLENVEVMLDTLNEVSNCCEVAISIVNDLLTFDKLEEGKMTLDLKETDIESYLTQTLKPFDIQARGKDIAISFVVEDSKDNWGSSNVLWLDQSKMGQVIRNLVSNAVKFTPARGTVCVSTSQIKVQVPDARRNKSSSSVPSFPQIAVREPLRTLGRKIAPLISGKHSLLDQKYSRQSTTLDGSSPQSVPHINYLRIEVRDSGAGISEENQKKLFGQYVQFNAGKLQQGNGSGLGLWISKGITELHGGCIGATSQGEGKGSTFFLELPLFPRSADFSMIRRNSFSSSLTRRGEFNSSEIGMHPKGSGIKPNISVGDLISLDRKICNRASSSECGLNSDFSDSLKISSCTGDFMRDDLEWTLHSMKSVSRTSFTVKKPNGLLNLSSFFRSDTMRIGCSNGGVQEDEEGEDYVARRKMSGPFIKPRDSASAAAQALETLEDHRSPSDITVDYTTSVISDPYKPSPHFPRRLRILVVDDSVPTRKLMYRVLMKRGYTVLTAEDGADCLRMMTRTPTVTDDSKYGGFDIVIMDDHMPNMSGKEASKVLRDGGYSGVICGVTGNVSLEDAVSFKFYGVDLVFPKPLDLDLFEKEMKVYVDRVRAQTIREIV